MKIIFCVEFYSPSVGGAQEVVRQIAERMAARGHDVTVATSWLAHRTDHFQKNVRIASFEVSGNLVKGIDGDVAAYRNFLKTSDADLIFFYAAQQWTFDAAWEIMDEIEAKMVLVPCGYSGLNLPSFARYFQNIPAILRKMHAVVYHSEAYRDVEFAQKLGLTNSVIIPNGAEIEEFLVEKDSGFRSSLDLSGDDFLLLTVGSLTGLKGHMELLHAFAIAKFEARRSVLILNGNRPTTSERTRSKLRRLIELAKVYGIRFTFRHAAQAFQKKFCWPSDAKRSVDQWVARINTGHYGKKRVLQVDLPREKLIQAYLQSDLFVFASNIEYSPLVLYEACCAGLPFLSVPVGNSTEIAEWTGGGVICDAPRDSHGYTRVDPAVLAESMENLIGKPEKLEALRRSGKRSSALRFNWTALSVEYETLFRKLVDLPPDAKAT